MGRFYYENNEILLPRWSAPARTRFPWGWVVIFLSVLGAACTAYYVVSFLPEQNARRATVLILVDQEGDGRLDGVGSGVFINPNGYILTCRHVVMAGDKPAAKVRVLYLSGTPEKIEMDASIQDKGADSSALNDWAVLRVTPSTPVAWITTSGRRTFVEEEGLKVYGFPGAVETITNDHGPAVKVLQGIINRVDTSNEGGVTRIIHSATTFFGMSGGPVVQGGRLIGINTSVLGGREHVSTNENYALPIYLLDEPVFSRYAPR